MTGRAPLHADSSPAWHKGAGAATVWPKHAAREGAANHPTDSSPMALAADIALLRDAPLFERMGEEELRLFAFGARKRVFREGETVWVRGADAPGGAIVMMGSLELTDANGARRTAEPGTLVEELALARRRPHDTTAVALEDGALMEIGRDLFHRMVEEYPGIAAHVADRVATRLETLLDAIAPTADRLSRMRD